MQSLQGKRAGFRLIVGLMCAGVFGAGKASAQCWMSMSPNPLALISVDYIDSFTGAVVYIAAGQGIVTAASPFPNCVQIGHASWTTSPLQLQQVFTPLPYPPNWISQYRYADSQAFVVTYYPFVAPGVADCGRNQHLHRSTISGHQRDRSDYF